jgi:hypothetical protein
MRIEILEISEFFIVQRLGHLKLSFFWNVVSPKRTILTWANSTAGTPLAAG